MLKNYYRVSSTSLFFYIYELVFQHCGLNNTRVPDLQKTTLGNVRKSA